MKTTQEPASLRVRRAAPAIDCSVRALDGPVWARDEDGTLRRVRLEEHFLEELQGRRDEFFAQLAAETGPPAGASTQTRAEDTNILEETSSSRQAPDRSAESIASRASHGSRRARMHLVIGPVGAGKSTFALKLACDHAAVRLTLDQWMAVLFREDRPNAGVLDWYVERTARCIEQIWIMAKDLLDVGTNVILEIGLLQRRERKSFYERVRDAGFDWTVHVLDAPRDVRRERVEARNREQGATFSMVVPPTIFELASDLWEAPDLDECAEHDVRFVHTNRRSDSP